MRKKIIVYVDDKDGYKVRLKWHWKRIWKVLTEEEQNELNLVFDKLYQKYCDFIKNVKLK